jgi:hypothetical protein
VLFWCRFSVLQGETRNRNRNRLGFGYCQIRFRVWKKSGNTRPDPTGYPEPIYPRIKPLYRKRKTFCYFKGWPTKKTKLLCGISRDSRQWFYKRMFTPNQGAIFPTNLVHIPALINLRQTYVEKTIVKWQHWDALLGWKSKIEKFYN